MVSREQIVTLVTQEMDLIENPAMKTELSKYLVAPTLQRRKWQYSNPPSEFTCWMVAVFPTRGLGIVYCDQGHGPDSPWALVDLETQWFGMDSEWFLRLDDAFIRSGMWKGPLPPDYEVR